MWQLRIDMRGSRRFQRFCRATDTFGRGALERSDLPDTDRRILLRRQDFRPSGRRVVERAALDANATPAHPTSDTTPTMRGCGCVRHARYSATPAAAIRRV